MANHLNDLAQQAAKLLPEFSKILSNIPQNQFYINYPLQLYKSEDFKCIYPNSSTFLKSKKLIRQNNHVFMLQSNQCFSSTNLAGATNRQQDQLNQNLQELKNKYEIFDNDMITRIKLTLAVQANSLDQDMILNKYAHFVLKTKRNSTLENYIKTYAISGFLKSLLGSNKIVIQTSYQYLHQHFLKQVKLESYAAAYQNVRYYSKQTNKHRIIFPFSNNIKHSFQPNCQLKTGFLTHRRQTFLYLNSIKQIRQGEQLTLNYGFQNNYEMFIRHGFAIANNPYSIFYLPLDYSQISSIFSQNMDWKMNMFKKNKHLKLKNFIRLDINGQINKQDLNMLKIVWSIKPTNKQDWQNDNNEQNKQAQQQIKQWVQRTAHKFWIAAKKMNEKREEAEMQQQQNRTKSPNSNRLEGQQAIRQNIKIIENEQNMILKKVLNSMK